MCVFQRPEIQNAQIRLLNLFNWTNDCDTRIQMFDGSLKRTPVLFQSGTNWKLQAWLSVPVKSTTNLCTGVQHQWINDICTPSNIAINSIMFQIFWEHFQTRFYLLWNCLLDTLGKTVIGWIVAALGWDVKVSMLDHFQIVLEELVRLLKLAVQRKSRISWEDEKVRVMDECQIPMIGIEPNIDGTRLYVCTKMICSLELLTNTTSDVREVWLPIVIYNNLFLSGHVKVLPLPLVFDDISQLKTLPFYAADNVFTPSAIAKMLNNRHTWYLSWISRIYPWRKIVMWRNFRFLCMTDVEKSKFSPYVE